MVLTVEVFMKWASNIAEEVERNEAIARTVMFRWRSVRYQQEMIQIFCWHRYNENIENCKRNNWQVEIKIFIFRRSFQTLSKYISIIFNHVKTDMHTVKHIHKSMYKHTHTYSSSNSCIQEFWMFMNYCFNRIIICALSSSRY